MTRSPIPALLATALVAVACVMEPPFRETHAHRRLRLLAQGYAARSSNPSESARLFAEAGAGTVLERARLEAWLGALEAARAQAAAWRKAAEQPLPADLSWQANRGLAEALAAAGETGAAVDLLEAAPPIHRVVADAALVEIGSPEARLRAARRLAVAAPERLYRTAPGLETGVVRELTESEWLQRAAAWRSAGAPARAAAELRGRRFRGELDERRRLEVARAETASGAPTRALRVLPRDGAEAQLLRAEAHRRRAWHRVPRSSASGEFRDCVRAARRGLAAAPTEVQRDTGLRLELECATEAGDLDAAMAAWLRLETRLWSDPRRDWLGRRLGVALATAGNADRVAEIAAAVPDEARCLAFWAAEAAGDTETLECLAAADLSDIYARWARDELGREPQVEVHLHPAAGEDDPPWSVGWLLEHAGAGEALREWRRLAAARGVTPGEALAAARVELGEGHPTPAIRWLRAGFPELGSIATADAPGDAVRAYLPLGWLPELTRAANETGLPPWLLAGLGRQESAFAPHARSPAGARGLLQLMPGTAAMHARALGLPRSPDLHDPAVNLRIGAHELARLLERYGALEPALAAYNAGPSRVDRWWKAWPGPRRFTEKIPIAETHTYVRRVSFLAEAYRLVYAEKWSKP